MRVIGLFLLISSCLNADVSYWGDDMVRSYDEKGSIYARLGFIGIEAILNTQE